jgi:NADH-quinone oxidoreductase subunit N
MNSADYMQLLRLALPEVIVALAGLAVIAVDLLFLRAAGRRLRFAVAAGLGSAGCVCAILRLVLAPPQPLALDTFFLATPLAHLLQIGLLVLAIFTLLLSVDCTFTEDVAEFVLLVLAATVGGMFLVATQDLIVIFLALELLSLSLYVLAAFDKRSPSSSEAALKYFLFGGMSAAFLLYGFSLLYGLSNSTSLVSVAAAIQSQSHGQVLNPLLLIAMLCAVIGFGFKVAAVPFHFWAPDVYQGAPAPSAAFIASGSKVASFFIFFQVMAIGFAGAEGGVSRSHFVSGWVPVLIILAVLSMLLGNLAAIVQSSLRRLLAYSAVAHAGYMLLAIVAHTPQSLAALIYYSVTYALAMLGVFGVLAAIEEKIGGDALAGFDGLSRRAPVLSFCLFLFVLSLAGIPPLSGFFAKFFLFASVIAARPGSMLPVWLVILAIAMSAVSLYYYLQVLKRIYVVDPPKGAGKIDAPMLSQLVICVLAAGVLLLGCAPQSFLAWIDHAIRASGM